MRESYFDGALWLVVNWCIWKRQGVNHDCLLTMKLLTNQISDTEVVQLLMADNWSDKNEPSFDMVIIEIDTIID